MTIKSALSVIALAAGLVAAPALAQDRMIGETAVPEADVAVVEAHCETLQMGDESTLSVSGEDEEDNSTLDPTDGDDTGEGDQPAGDGATASIDLSLITLEDCEAGGWLAE